jgi:hypothetical protein
VQDHELHMQCPAKHANRHGKTLWQRQPRCLFAALAMQMAPAPEGWQGTASVDGLYEVYRGPERAYLAKRLVPGVQYCARVKAVNSEVRNLSFKCCCRFPFCMY